MLYSSFPGTSRNTTYQQVTGLPKGVPITHANLCNLISWHIEEYNISAGDRATLIAAPAFDASAWELWPYLSAGASVHIPNHETRLDPVALVKWLRKERITHSFLPTPLAEAVLTRNWPRETKLRVLLTGGDRLSRWKPKGLPFRLVNHYGPTENTVVSTCTEVTSGNGSSTTPPIGKPISNTKAVVMDARLRPAPIGVPGELLVGGAQLAAGYWNRAELSAVSFVADPYSRNSKSRL